MNEVLPQQVVLTETYLQIYERRQGRRAPEPPAPKEDVDMPRRRRAGDVAIAT